MIVAAAGRAVVVGAVLAGMAAGCSGDVQTPVPTATTSAVMPTQTAQPLMTALTIPTQQATVTARAPLLPTPGAPFAPQVMVINGQEFTLEVAQTDEERARGLMGRTSLPDDYGMLFVYADDRLHQFWMKDTKLPLDILWIRADGAVVDVQTMPPEARTPGGQFQVFTPSGPARLVVEMNAGLANQYDIKPGSHVDFF